MRTNKVNGQINNVFKVILLTYKHLTCNVRQLLLLGHYLYFNGDFE
jgi:hypothetical protein